MLDSGAAPRQEGNDARHRSEERFRRLVEVSSQIVWVTDAQGCAVEDSPSWRAYTGRSLEQWLGTAWLEAIHPCDRQRVAAAWNTAVATAGPYKIEFRQIHHSGEYRHIACDAAPILNPDGSVREWVGMNVDITERKRTEANGLLLTDVLRLLNRGGELRSVIAEVLQLVRAVSGFDVVGLRLRQGEDFPYYEQDGFSQEFIKEENFLCARGGDGAIVRGSDGSVVLECTCGLVLTGRTDPTMPCFTAGGSFWTNASRDLLALPPENDPRINPRNRCIHDGYASVALFPIRAGAEIIGLLQLNDRRPGRFTPELIAFYENVSQNIGIALQRTIAEAALRDSDARLKRSQQIAHVGSWELDLLKNELVWSDEVYRIFGLQPQEFGATYEAFLDHVHPDDRTKVDGAYTGSLRDGRDSYEIEHRVIRTSNGEIRTVHEKCQHYRDGSGKIVRSVGMVQDITERKRTEDALQKAMAEAERANKAKDEFLAVLSHELRTPLTSILGWVRILEKQRVDDALRTKGLKVIERGVNSQTRLIEDLLDVSRIIAGKLDIDRAPVDFAAITRTVVESFRPAAETKGIELHVHGSRTVLPVDGDAGRLQQVVWNLVSNSIKFTPEGGQIEISLRAEHDRVIMAVRDNGRGIVPSFLPHIFDRFAQEDSSTTRREGGLGLGLAIVQHIVHMHRGQITAHSDGAGKGALFTVTLPRTATQANQGEGNVGK
jgi:PAS domain S-box-containing protein